MATGFKTLPVKMIVSFSSSAIRKTNGRFISKLKMSSPNLDTMWTSVKLFEKIDGKIGH